MTDMLRYQWMCWVGAILLMSGFAGCGSGGRSVGDPSPSRAETQQVVLRVPNMHCPHGCYPVVSQTLSAIPGVQGVALVPQAAQDAIDDPRVTVTYTGTFDGASAISALTSANFPDSAIDSPTGSAPSH